MRNNAEPIPEDAAGGGVSTPWRILREAAAAAGARELEFEIVLARAILTRASFAEAVSYRVGAALGYRGATRRAFLSCAAQAAAQSDFEAAAIADLVAFQARDPAASTLLEPFLFAKGFAALQAHRVAHWLWRDGQPMAALRIQHDVSTALQVDIHPAARIGRSVLLDHATGIVIGETARIDDGVSLLQGVTLGGTGKQAGDRHPKVGRDVMIGAGAIVLGNVMIGAGAKVAAGSVLLQSVAPGCTVAGVPARVIHGGSV